MTSSIKISASFTATFAIILFFMLAAITDQPAQAQTFTVLHNFNNFPDGKYPKAGLTMDAAGNLYGTASQGGDPNCNNGDGCGTVFRLQRTAHGWVVACFSETAMFPPRFPYRWGVKCDRRKGASASWSEHHDILD